MGSFNNELRWFDDDERELFHFKISVISNLFHFKIGWYMIDHDDEHVLFHFKIGVMSHKKKK